ncbi:restriction endonuclease subunit S [Candidatus Azambacteria bacterium]|nr:restriction endonuclease subunit S [Candidatus Azambacteria bacterium]
MPTYSIIKKSQLEGTKRLDAEYYQPEYLALQENLEKTKSIMPWGEIEGKFITGPFGSEFDTENYVQDGEYRYVRGKDVKDFFPTDGDNVYIPKKDYERLKKYSLLEGDILVSVVGTPGIGAIVDSTLLPAIFSCKSTVYRTTSINPFYFIAYLNSSYGRKLLERGVRGAVQTGLNINDLRDLPVFLPNVGIQEEIGDVVKNAKKTFDSSKSLYFQAENLLLEELGLKDFESESGLWSAVNLSEVQKANRIDAEYFDPKYQKILSLIRGNDGMALGELAAVKKGFEAGSEAYQEEGKLFIRVSSISKDGITDKDQKYLKDELYDQLKKEYQPKVGEILLTKDASPGIAHVVKEPIEGIISGGVLRVRLKEDVEPEYCALVINSIIGKLQVERDAGGSIIAHWKPDQVKELQVPILPKPTQQKIDEFVRKSHEARRSAKLLLEQAKKKVEDLIENKTE